MSTAVRTRARDHDCHRATRAATRVSNAASAVRSVTRSVRDRISCTVGQSTSPRASTAATFGNRLSKPSAWATSALAADADRFSAAATSADVRRSPVTIM